MQEILIEGEFVDMYCFIGSKTNVSCALRTFQPHHVNKVNRVNLILVDLALNQHIQYVNQLKQQPNLKDIFKMYIVNVMASKSIKEAHQHIQLLIRSVNNQTYQRNYLELTQRVHKDLELEMVHQLLSNLGWHAKKIDKKIQQGLTKLQNVMEYKEFNQYQKNQIYKIHKVCAFLKRQ